jgi:hypothetical protein
MRSLGRRSSAVECRRSDQSGSRLHQLRHPIEHPPPSAGQEGFFLEIFSNNGMVLPGPLFEYTQAGNYSTYYLGGHASIADLPVISASVPEPSIWALLLLGFTGIGFSGYGQAKKRGQVG